MTVAFNSHTFFCAQYYYLSERFISHFLWRVYWFQEMPHFSSCKYKFLAVLVNCIQKAFWNNFQFSGGSTQKFKKMFHIYSAAFSDLRGVRWQTAYYKSFKNFWVHKTWVIHLSNHELIINYKTARSRAHRNTINQAESTSHLSS